MRPRIYVLAGANGAGKSALVGRALTNAGGEWFNPDTYARELTRRERCDWASANLRAGVEGIRLFRVARELGHDHAFETTLGGRTMVRKLMTAAGSHDVIVWFCGLSSVDLYLDRVRTRVGQGGHDVAEVLVRRRCAAAPRNLIALLPHIAHLQVYDNSLTVPVGTPIPDPQLVLDMTASALLYPRASHLDQLRHTPSWAIPIVEAALQLHER